MEKEMIEIEFDFENHNDCKCILCHKQIGRATSRMRFQYNNLYTDFSVKKYAHLGCILGKVRQGLTNSSQKFLLEEVRKLRLLNDTLNKTKGDLYDRRR